MIEVALNPIPGEQAGRRRFACLRELRGCDELELGELEPAAVNDLLRRLLVDVPGASITADRLEDARIGDRDCLVAALYTRCFGDGVDSQTRCRSCQRPFEVTFSLAEEIEIVVRDARQAEEREPALGPDGEGYYRLPDGISFRLATVADERRLLALPAAARQEALLALCVRRRPDEDGGAGAVDVAAVERAMAARDPGVGLNLVVPCALCGVRQSIDFDMVEFFRAAVERERPLLIREIHAIARAYRWSFQDIVELPRRQRHEQVEVIEGEREAMGASP
jgi:hypothetical protein